MKNILAGFLTAVFCLSLTACGGKEVKDFDPAADAQTLLSSSAFTETLEEIDRDTACSLYGIDSATVTGSAVYGSTGATAEELALFTFEDSDGAEAAATALGYRIEDRKEELADYLPDEISKLDEAVVETRGNSVLFVVAADYAPVDQLLEAEA